MNIRLNKHFIQLTDPKCLLENVGSNDDVVEIRIFAVPEDDEQEIDFDEPTKIMMLRVNDKGVLNIKGGEVAYARMNVGLTGILNCSVMEYEVEVPSSVYTKDDVNDLLKLKVDKLEFKASKLPMNDGTMVEKCLQDRISQESKISQSVNGLAQNVQTLSGKVTAVEQAIEELKPKMSSAEESIKGMNQKISSAEGEVDTLSASVDGLVKEFAKFQELPAQVQLLKSNFTSLSEQLAQVTTDLHDYKESQAGLLQMYTQLEFRVQQLEGALRPQ